MLKALIDGDILCYRLGFATQSSDGTDVLSEPLVRYRVDEFLSDLLVFDLPDCADYEGYLSTDSSSNFRVPLAVTVPYKGQRIAEKPKNHGVIQKYLLTEWGFHDILGQEADDSLAQEQTKLGDNSIIVSIDKDMLQVPGWHYNFVRRERIYVTPDTGFYNFCIQMLTGDRADNIVGIRGIGPVKAARCLAEADNDYLRLKAVSDVYRQNGDDLLRHFRENASLLWLRRQTDGSPELIDTMIERLNEDIFGKAEGTQATTASQGLPSESVPAA